MYGKCFGAAGLFNSRRGDEHASLAVARQILRSQFNAQRATGRLPVIENADVLVMPDITALTFYRLVERQRFRIAYHGSRGETRPATMLVGCLAAVR